MLSSERDIRAIMEDKDEIIHNDAKDIINCVPNLKKVKVVDSQMGDGKTTYMINHMNECDEEERFIFVTPYLSEIQRIKEKVTNRKFYEPTSTRTRSKTESFKKLLLEGRDIATTHALFQYIDEDIIGLISMGNYTLVLDEVMNVIEQVPIKRDTIRILVDAGAITINDDGSVLWHKEKYRNTDLMFVENMCDRGNLFLFNDVAFVWTFPADIFKAFNDVYILTYLFEGQLQSYYYKMFNIEYEKYAIEKIDGKYTLIPHEDKVYDMERLKGLINIYDGKLNNIGETYTLSSTFYSNASDIILKKMRQSVEYYFKKNVGTKSKENMWTCFKSAKDKVKGKGYSKGFVPFNARATNEYQEKQSLAYLVNRYLNPIEKRFFTSRGIKVDESMFALSEVLQWVWRSRIRKGEPINLFIPSERMRDLLVKFLNGDI